ncbi:uncharacterized protein AB675_511 [Cyphellophora attinorum]|uniref:Uncharacterized protein n=1 Tax=Cyphellophora attinorum TaxID=1664694 RepID=A0A0N1P4H2_9EURO|nr:uncharacterized protein AB675_511 [Phialophora attinorum]KPI45694.1 hypothetical protein AB675_511 [Phialophora attinorum]
MGLITHDTHKLGESKPIEHFRPRLFKELDRKQSILKLDLFWSISMKENGLNPRAKFLLPEDDSDHDDPAGDDHIFPIHELEPLVSFRNLKVLQLCGMMQSYQPVIWRVVWANPNLEVLTLEMSLPPLFNTNTNHPNRVIDSNWTIFPSITPRPSMSSDISPALTNDDDLEPAYLGNQGSGRLDPSFGSGDALPSYHRFLSIAELNLMNFVVDGIPFVNWFDPSKLRRVSFRGCCVDAGFYLHPSMKHTVSLLPPVPAAANNVGVALRVPVGGLLAARAITPIYTGTKLVELKGGRVIPARVVLEKEEKKESKFRVVREALKGKLARRPASSTGSCM